MAAFLVLLNFTNQGVRSVKDTTKWVAATCKLVKTVDIDMRAIY